ncbi:MAG: putative toxin-antitoxin system toxin component, PIN family [Candidatus Micrarchaeaceae archaeon]|jgi:uncharacterized protein
MGKRKIVLDTNILISALGWEGNLSKILDKVVDGELEFFISYDQFNEFLRVINYPRLKFSEEQKARFEALISNLATFVKTQDILDVIKDDPSDNMILECALVANADYIVSGDLKHVLPIKKLGRIKIVTAKEFLKLLK